MLGTQDLVIGLVLAFFLFGAKRLPELASSLGKSMKEFKKAVEGGHTAEPEAPPPAGELPAAPVTARACTSCQAVLDPDWRHCPRCGTPAPPPANPPS